MTAKTTVAIAACWNNQIGTLEYCPTSIPLFRLVIFFGLPFCASHPIACCSNLNVRSVIRGRDLPFLLRISKSDIILLLMKPTVSTKGQIIFPAESASGMRSSQDSRTRPDSIFHNPLLGTSWNYQGGGGSNHSLSGANQRARLAAPCVRLILVNRSRITALAFPLPDSYCNPPRQYLF